ncbi:MAG: Hsp33 family molecular chaperone HslO [Alphaproteobacteria bacterium]|nr:Hsp33 family molecular chaperone HslO [Alphaproteobacteria bacterium]
MTGPGPGATADGGADDLVLPFQIDAFGLRGRLVRLGATLDTILTRHDYPEPVARILGEALVLAAALAATLKYDGVFTLQTKGDGPVSMMVADVTTTGAMRGYAQVDRAKLETALARPGPGPAGGALSDPVPRLLGAGYLAFTVDQGADTERYQGIVELAGATLSDCIHHYFRQSEQFQAAINLAVGKVAAVPGGRATWRGGALMIQRLPDPQGADAEDKEEGWRSAMALMASGSRHELLDPALPPSQLLFRLFHEGGVRVYRAKHVGDACRCSRQRVVGMLRGLPRADLDDLKVEGAFVVTCEFCNRRYTVADEELDAAEDARPS